MLRSAGIYFLVRVLAAALALMAVAVFTRLVPPELYGIYTLVMSTSVAIFAVGYQWLRASVLRFVPGENTTPEITLQAVFVGYLLVSALLGLLTLILATGGFLPVGAGLTLIGLAVTLAYAAMEIIMAAFQARKNPRYYALLTIARSFGSLIVGAVLAIAGFGGTGLLVGVLTANLLPLIALRFIDDAKLPELHVNREELRRIAAFGLPLGLVGIGGTIIALSDRYLLAWLIGVDAAGAYAAPYDLAQRSLSVLLLSAFLACSPNVFGLFSEGKLNEARWAMHAQMSLSLVVALPTATLLAVTSPLISQILFGEAFRQTASALLPWITAASLLQGVQSYYFSYGFTLPKRAGMNAMIVASGALLNLPLNLIFIPSMGIVGAAVATIISYAAVLFVSIIITRQWIALPWPLADTVKVVASCAIAVPVLLMANNAPSVLFGLVLAAVGGLVMATALLASDACGVRRILLRTIRQR
ncbi:MAG: oligosaccharide flippase family protein [Geminicoccaceae bacterium]